MSVLVRERHLASVFARVTFRLLDGGCGPPDRPCRGSGVGGDGGAGGPVGAPRGVGRRQAATGLCVCGGVVAVLRDVRWGSFGPPSGRAPQGSCGAGEWEGGRVPLGPCPWASAGEPAAPRPCPAPARDGPAGRASQPLLPEGRPRRTPALAADAESILTKLSEEQTL